jgi:hypothetical protein
MVVNRSFGEIKDKIIRSKIVINVISVQQLSKIIIQCNLLDEHRSIKRRLVLKYSKLYIKEMIRYELSVQTIHH